MDSITLQNVNWLVKETALLGTTKDYYYFRSFSLHNDEHQQLLMMGVKRVSLLNDSHVQTCLSLVVRVLICSLYDSSRWLA